MPRTAKRVIYSPVLDPSVLPAFTPTTVGCLEPCVPEATWYPFRKEKTLYDDRGHHHPCRRRACRGHQVSRHFFVFQTQARPGEHRNRFRPLRGHESGIRRRDQTPSALAAVENVLREQVADRDNLAFREFGGPCGSEDTQLALKFDQNNVDHLCILLHDVHAEGQASLAHAVIDASGDFNDPERFKGVIKRIVVITSGEDACIPNATDAIRERLERNKRSGFEIQLDYHYNQRVGQINEILRQLSSAEQ